MLEESPESKRRRAALVLKLLEKTYPEARTELEYGTPFQLLVATILSAQATDVSVNAATPRLFDRYPDAWSMARATPEELEPYIKTIGLYRGKARNLVRSARTLVERHGGEVPNDFDEIIKLPGVGRKTANVVLASAFGRAAIAVDTHVGRLSRRLGFSAHLQPDKVEADLMEIFPEEAWIFVHHALILHGRRVCHARRPRCADCALVELCPSRQL
jgi:endonuclease III